ncbi:MAG: carbohydrate deacetylase [Nitrospirota bacterium]
MKRLIVNADDFGMAESVNDGIMKGHKDGIITSASFMAGAMAAEHAAKLARDNPSLGIGVHLCLTLIKPVSDLANLPTLSPNGLLPGGPFALMARLLAGKIKKHEIEIELRAQMERAIALGIRPDHIDGHQHIHMMPGIFDVVLKLANEYNISAMRYPVGPQVGKTGLVRKFEKLSLEGFSKRNKSAIEDAGIKTPDYFFGLAETGALSRESLMNILNHLPDGTSELMCHPGLPSENYAEDNWGKGWGMELEAVTDGGIKEILEKQSINKIKFQETLLTKYPPTHIE